MGRSGQEPAAFPWNVRLIGQSTRRVAQPVAQAAQPIRRLCASRCATAASAARSDDGTPVRTMHPSAPAPTGSRRRSGERCQSRPARRSSSSRSSARVVSSRCANRPSTPTGRRFPESRRARRDHAGRHARRNALRLRRWRRWCLGASQLPRRWRMERRRRRWNGQNSISTAPPAQVVARATCDVRAWRSATVWSWRAVAAVRSAVSTGSEVPRTAKRALREPAPAANARAKPAVAVEHLPRAARAESAATVTASQAYSGKAAEAVKGTAQAAADTSAGVAAEGVVSALAAARGRASRPRPRRASRS